MKRLLLFFATSLLLTTGVAWGQAPAINSPAIGATNLNPYSVTMAGPLNRVATRIRIQLMAADNVTVLAQTGAIASSGPDGGFSTTVSPYAFNYNLWVLLQNLVDDNPATTETFRVRVQSSTRPGSGWFTGADGTVQTSGIRLFTVKEPAFANPLVVSPQASPAVNLCNPLSVVTNTNYSGVRSYDYLIYPTSLGLASAIAFSSTPVAIASPALAVANNSLIPAIDRNLFKGNTEYTIELYTYSAQSNPIGSSASTFTTGPTPNTAPVVTAPANNATNVSFTPTITVAAYSGDCGTLTSAQIELDNGSPSAPANWMGASYQTTTIPNSNGPFTWNPSTALNSNTSYQIRVIFSTASGPLDTTVTTFRTINTDPILNTPADGSTVNLCSDLPLSITPNNAAATSIEVSISINNPRTLVGGPYLVSVTAGQEFNPLAVTIPRSVLNANTQYLLEIKALNAGNNPVGAIYPTLFSPPIDPTAAATNTPVITAPADGANVNSFTPVIQIQSPFQGCRLDSVRYEILDGFSGSTVVTSALFATATYSWTVPVFLTAGAPYRARVTYYTGNGTFNDTNAFTVSTTPGVTVTSPLTLEDLNPCGFPVVVAQYPGANAVRVDVRRTSGTPDPDFDPLAGNTPYPDAGLVYSAQSGGNYTFNFGSTRLQPEEEYEMRIVAGSVTGGVFDPIEGSEDTVAFTTGLIPNLSAPALISPTDDEAGVSRTPTFILAPPAGDCGTLVNFNVTVVPIGQEWEGPDQKFFDLNTADFNLTTRSLTVRLVDSLLASTTYKLRIQRRMALNGKDIYDGNYNVDDNDPAVYTFTTIDQFETKFDLATSASNTVGGVIYLNSLVQTIRLTPVGGATQYEIQLSTDPTFATVQYTATSPNTTFTFNANAPGLESSTRYFIRARVTQPTLRPWTTTPNIRSFVNSLHPSYADRPVGNIASTSTRLRGWHVRNATSMFFQLATDPNFTNIVTAPGPYGPVAVDPATGQANVHERYSYRRWVGGSLVGVPIANASDAGFAPFNTLGEYDYVRFLVPGQTYYLRVKNVRQAPDGTYLQTGYWANVAAFTPALVARTHTFSLLGAPNAVPVNLVANMPYIQTNPQNAWNVLERQVELSTDAAFTNIVLTRSDFNGGPGFLLNTTLAFSTNYFMRVRSRASNDPGGPTVWTPWSSTFAFRTMDPTSGRVAAAAMSDDGSQLVQTVAFPNPFVDNIAVSVKSSHKAVTLSLVDASGRVVDKASTLGGYTVLLGKKHLAQGLYLIRITDENGLLETLKVVKQ